MLLIALLLTAPDIHAEQSGPFASLTVDAGLAPYSPQAQVTGALRIQGSDTMSPLMTRLATEFQRRQPQVTVNVKGGGSTKAVAEFLEIPIPGRIILKEERTNQFLLVATSRELLDAEIKQFVSQHGYEPLAVPVAVDAVALYVHKDNPLPGLTLDQVDAIFSTTRKRGYKNELKQWGQLGLGNGWEKGEIQLYGRDRKSGTRAFFQEHVLAGGEFAPQLQEQPGAASVVLALSRDQLGIGYNGLGLQASAVRMVPLAENQGMPFILPSSATISDQTYPLRRVLYVYLDKSPKSPLPPAAQEFLTFITSREGQEAVVRAGFFPLPTNQVTKKFLSLGTTPTPGTTTGQ
ncbi:MAG: PstS family phosphate ABC transporter substrate-binding protein [Nitrospirae bacterium]|nr:PstS family phosphate ABC transporter substrate-binding protein [Nitrospirota bacterium]